MKTKLLRSVLKNGFVILPIVALPLAGSFASKADDRNRSEIPLDAPWKQKVHDFAAEKLKHSAWGLQHSKRDYLLSLELAAEDGVTVDRDVLFAAAFLHDMGGFPEFATQGVDHAVRSAELVESILVPAAFPAEKVQAVKDAILTHSYYSTTPPTTPEAIVLHDADTLDFLGIIGLTRIVSLTEREAVASDLKQAVGTTGRLLQAAPGALVGGAAKRIGERRTAELKAALDALSEESFGNDHL